MGLSLRTHFFGVAEVVNERVDEGRHVDGVFAPVEEYLVNVVLESLGGDSSRYGLQFVTEGDHDLWECRIEAGGEEEEL